MTLACNRAPRFAIARAVQRIVQRVMLPVLAFIATSAALAVSPLSAQTACSVSNPGNQQTRSCSVTLSATLRLPVQTQVSLSSSSTDIAGGAPATNQIFAVASDTGLVVMGPLLQVLSNRGVSVTLVNAPQFTGPGIKPASDVRLGVSGNPAVCTGVATSPLSVSPVAVQQSAPRLLFQSTAAVNNAQRRLCLRVFWRYATDGPGAYSLPLTISVTAP
jgi:hypothetical protein